MISDLGIAVHTGVGTANIAPAQRNRPVRRSADNDSMRITLSDESFIDAGVIVFAAGVRPRDELARDAGLAIAERGGVLTDLTCATDDPNIYAIGEVAAINGRCYGLVGPGYTSAEVVADRLLGGGAEFGEADMSTKLKLLGVDVASFGDAMGATRTVSRWRSTTPSTRPTPSWCSPTMPRRCSGHPRRRRVGVRRAATDGGRRAARRRACADRARRIRGGGDWVSARCRPPRKSARATTSRRAISPRPSRAAAVMCPS